MWPFTKNEESAHVYNEELSFEQNYQQSALESIKSAEEEIADMQDQADYLEQVIADAIADRQKVIDSRNSLISFVNRQRNAVGLEQRLYDGSEEDDSSEEDTSFQEAIIPVEEEDEKEEGVNAV